MSGKLKNWALLPCTLFLLQFAIDARAANPSIDVPPVSQAVPVGGTVNFRAAVSGTGPFTYQWQFDYAPLANVGRVSGATSSNLVITDLRGLDEGPYRLIVAGPSGTATSDVVRLAVVGTWPAYGLATSVFGPGTLTYWWKVSSETNNDTFGFYLDGILQSAISGEVAWQLRSARVPRGYHSAHFRYETNATVSAGQDQGWLDEWQFVPDPDACNHFVALGGANYGPGYITGITGTVDVVTSNNCVWSVQSTNSWLTILSPATNVGSGTATYVVAPNPGTPRTGLIRIAEKDILINQDGGGCPYVFSPSNSVHSGSSETGLVSVIAQTGCPWYALNTNGWISIVSPISGNGTGVVRYVVAVNPTPSARVGNLLIAGQPYAVTQLGSTAADCPFDLFPTNRSHGFGSATNFITVTTFPHCPWTVFNTNSWVNILSPTNGVGYGTIAYSIQGNAPGVTRSGNVIIGGQLFAITQSGSTSAPPCGFVISPASATHSSTSSTGLVSVGAAGCSWTVANTNAWVTILSGANGSGNGLVRYRLVENFGSARSGNLLIADQLFAITQLASSSVSLPEALDTDAGPLVWTTTGTGLWSGRTLVTHDGVDAAQSGDLPDSGSASMETTLTGPGTVSFWWKVSSETNSDALRFYINGSAQTGISGEAGWEQRTFSIAAGSQTLRWTYAKNASLTAGQDRAWVDQFQFSPVVGCSFAISPTYRLHNYGWETGSVSVYIFTFTNPCVWSVINTNPWVSIVSGSNGIGFGTVSYVLAANPTGLDRTGFLTIAGKTLQIDQFGGPVHCSYALSETGNVHGSSAENGSVTLIALPDCPWTVNNTNAWITINSGLNGTGAREVTYSVAANPTAHARSGNISIVGQMLDVHNFSVTQLGSTSGPCSFAISPTNRTHGSGISTGLVSVTTATGCSWAVFNTNGWVSILSGSNGLGSGTVIYRVAANAGAARSGNINIAGRIFAITQSGGTSAPCIFGISPTSGTHNAGTATGLVSVTTVTGCSWVVINTNSWVTIATGASGSGNGLVRYILSQNTAAVPRSGNLLVAGRLYAITQSANANVSLAEALDTLGTSLVWGTTGTPVWFGQSAFSHDGVDAAQSGPGGHGAAVTVQTTVNGPGTISFWWKVSSEADKDYLKFFINGVQQTRISGEVDWEARSFNLPSGAQTLKWTYSKNASGSAGLDKGWVDQVQFLTPTSSCTIAISQTSATHSSNSETGLVNVITAPGCPWGVINTNPWLSILSGASGSGNGLVRYRLTENFGAARRGNLLIGGQLFAVTQSALPPTNAPVSFAEALDTVGTPLVWDTTGTPVWFGQTSVSHDGVDAAQSGPVGHGAAVTVQTTVNGPGTISFWWKVSSEANSDYLKFFINGVQQTRISGEVNWESRSFTVPSGTQVLKWTYSKNASGSAGLDKGWVDQVQFLGGTGNCVVAISPTSRLHGYGAATGTVAVTAQSGCNWSVSNTNAWIAISSSLDNSGSGQLTYSVAANPISSPARSGTIRIGGQIFTVSQPAGPPLTLAEALDTAETGFIWGTDWKYGWSPITDVTHDGVDAARSAIVGYLHDFTSSSMDTHVEGPGTLTFWWKAFSATNNCGSVFYISGSERVAISGNFDWQQQTITIPAGPQTLSWHYWNSGPGVAGDHGWVDQVQFVPTAGCPLTISPGSAELPPVNFHGSIQVNAAPDCPWSVSTSNAWIYIQLPRFGTGTGTVDYIVSANPSASVLSGSIRIADQIFVITQAAGTTNPPDCAISILPTTASLGWGSSTGIVSVTTSGCAWSAVSTNPWVSILSGANGTMNGTLVYAVAANTSPSIRSGNIRIGDQNFPITQLGTSTGCTISISPTNRSHGSANATGTVSVTTQAGCVWSVIETNTWITILSSLSNSNSGTAIYSIAPNTNSPARTGTIRIGGQNFVITQSGAALSGTNAPQISLVKQAGNGATLSLRGEAGKMYVVECSVDLINWVPISTNSAPATITDTPAGNAPRRFYRTVELP